MQKNFIAIGFVLFTSLAHAQPELINSPECIVPALTNTYGERFSSTARIDITSKSEIGKEYQEGAIIYYNEYKDAEKFYYAQSDIKITNPSPLNRNYSLKKDGKFIVKFSFKNKAGKVFDIVSFDDIVWFAIDEDGLLCNGGYTPQLEWGLNNLFKYSVEPHTPLKARIEQTKNQAQANVIKAVALQFLKADELQLTLQRSILIDDQIKSTSKFTINAMKGAGKIGNIDLKFHITNNRNLVIDEITESK